MPGVAERKVCAHSALRAGRALHKNDFNVDVKMSVAESAPGAPRSLLPERRARNARRGPGAWHKAFKRGSEVDAVCAAPPCCSECLAPPPAAAASQPPRRLRGSGRSGRAALYPSSPATGSTRRRRRSHPLQPELTAVARALARQSPRQVGCKQRQPPLCHTLQAAIQPVSHRPLFRCEQARSLPRPATRCRRAPANTDAARAFRPAPRGRRPGPVAEPPAPLVASRRARCAASEALVLARPALLAVGRRKRPAAGGEEWRSHARGLAGCRVRTFLRSPLSGPSRMSGPRRRPRGRGVL